MTFHHQFIRAGQLARALDTAAAIVVTAIATVLAVAYLTGALPWHLTPSPLGRSASQSLSAPSPSFSPSSADRRLCRS